MKASNIPSAEGAASPAEGYLQGQAGDPHLPGHDRDGHEHSHGFEIPDLLRILLVAAGATAVWFKLWEPFPSWSVIGILATLIGGYPIFREAIENAVERRMTMELSMTIALLAALLTGEFFTTLIITLFVLIAEVLEGLTVGRGRKAIRDILHYLPQTAVRIRNGNPEVIPLELVKTEDIVMIRPGTRVPVDGVVASGASYVDQSTITGEPIPVEKIVGSEVFAGTMNQSGVLEVKTLRLGRDTSFGKIIQAIERAERSRAPIQKTADRLSGYLVYFALAAALLTFAITRNIRSTISVIIVAGACGVAAGTPLAILGAIGRAARMGSIIKGGLYLELLSSVDTVFFDKTGTLTYGKPEVVEITTVSGVTQEEVLRAAGIAERGSEHPTGRAIAAYAAAKVGAPPAPEEFCSQPGKGVTARYASTTILVGTNKFLAENGIPVGESIVPRVYVASNGSLLGTIVVDDRVRPEAAKVVRDLREMNIATVLLTGDSRAVAIRLGKKLDVDDVRAELLPEQKLDAIRESMDQNKKVAMVGDGVNDAPALAEATVGIAMGSGTDVARESADVVLIGNDLNKFVETVRIAKRCRTIIMQNFYGTILVDSVGIVLAAIGLLNPLLAAFIHVTSELMFILNSARLLPKQKNLHHGRQVADIPHRA